MAKIIAGRYTAQTDQPFVVFLIGMRINKLRAVRKWVPTVMPMGPMLRELFAHPEKGLLGALPSWGLERACGAHSGCELSAVGLKRIQAAADAPARDGGDHRLAACGDAADGILHAQDAVEELRALRGQILT